MSIRFKGFILLLVSYLVISSVSGQIEDPVKWKWKAYDLGNSEYELVFTSDIEEHWHTYSQYLSSNDGPLPTWFSFNESEGWAKVDSVMECSNVTITEFDPNFDMELAYFEGKVNWWQKIKLNSDTVTNIKGFLSFMVCDESKCLPPKDIDFDFDLSQATAKPADFEMCPEPVKKALHDENGALDHDNIEEESETPWGLFILGLGLGFAAVFTPCVFPLIPMTVSFFTKQSKSKAQGIRNALFYGFCIIFIYTGLGLLISAIFGGDALYALSSHPVFNLFLFAILILFGLSFLGAFDIQLPASWANKADSAADRGGLIGIFFMAATLAIVSFSCTGPIVGAALGESASGGFLGPAAIMFGFSLALSLPFMFFAAFPGWLNALPQSGGWLNSVKVVLGLVEIGFAFKFLSNADLAYQWHFLERELFITIWIAVSACITLYLFGKLRFPHDSPFEKMSIPRFLFGFMFFIMTIYLLPGIWGAPLKLIAGFPPPAFYAESAGAFANGGDSHGGGPTLHIEPDFQNDLEAARKKAKEEGKPVLVDYTGWTCVNCRKMEENVWIVPEVARILKEEVVLLSLYTDDRSEIPAAQQRTETLEGGSTIKIKRLGDEWKYKEAKDHGTIAQPFYCFEDFEGNLILKEGVGYDPDPQFFIDFLEKGLEKFNSSY
tara:strand:- start:3732 stop:5723 length:1992 start_codon:yes stop_codon:yes gene_type:complete